MFSFNNTIPLAFDFSRPEHYFIFLFHIIFGISVVFLGGSVVIAISCTKSLLCQNRFIFMLNTSISDTLVGFATFYLNLFDVKEELPSRNGTYYILPSLLGINAITFLSAQFDRYLAVCHPFFYDGFITQPIVVAVCVYSWIHTYSILLARNVVPVPVARQLGAVGIIGIQAIVIIQIIMTIKLYAVARYQLERDPPSAEKENKKESLRIIIVVVIIFLLLWSPSFINIIVLQQTRRRTPFRNRATHPFVITARFNALTTPVVYIWGSPALREALKKAVWGRVCPKTIRSLVFSALRRKITSFK